MSEKASKESKREEAGLGDAREKNRRSRDRKKNREEKGSEMGLRAEEGWEPKVTVTIKTTF